MDLYCLVVCLVFGLVVNPLCTSAKFMCTAFILIHLLLVFVRGAELFLYIRVLTFIYFEERICSLLGLECCNFYLLKLTHEVFKVFLLDFLIVIDLKLGEQKI